MGVRIVHGPGDLTDDDDRLLAVAPTRHVRWNRVLVWFMRILALCWIAKGLIAWAGILGVTGGTPFELRASGHQATDDLLRRDRSRGRRRLVADVDLGRRLVVARCHEPPHPGGVLSPLRCQFCPPHLAIHPLSHDVLDYILACGGR
jgi:hypothetical protein